VAGEVDGVEQASQAVAQVTDASVALLRRVIAATAMEAAGHVRAQYFGAETGQNRLKVRTGKLRASVRSLRNTVEGGKTVKGGIGIGTVYGRVQIGPKGQKTTIVPKTKKWLTIPLPAAQTKAGVLRGSAMSGMWGETFFVQTAKGNLILFGRQIVQRGPRAGQSKGKVVPLFLLRKSVEVPARVHPEDILSWIAPRIIERLKAAGITVKT